MSSRDSVKRTSWCDLQDDEGSEFGSQAREARRCGVPMAGGRQAEGGDPDGVPLCPVAHGLRVAFGAESQLGRSDAALGAGGGCAGLAKAPAHRAVRGAAKPDWPAMAMAGAPGRHGHGWWRPADAGT